VLYLVGMFLVMGSADAPVVLLLLVFCLVVPIDWIGLRTICGWTAVRVDTCVGHGVSCYWWKVVLCGWVILKLY
jgi:hypothetical protein